MIKNNLDFSGVGITTSYFGTELWGYCEDRGLLPRKLKFEKLVPNIDPFDDDAIIFSDAMTKNEFLNAYKSMRRKLRFSRRIRHPITSPKTLIGI